MYYSSLYSCHSVAHIFLNCGSLDVWKNTAVRVTFSYTLIRILDQVSLYTSEFFYLIFFLLSEAECSSWSEFFFSLFHSFSRSHSSKVFFYDPDFCFMFMKDFLVILIIWSAGVSSSTPFPSFYILHASYTLPNTCFPFSAAASASPWS